MIRFGKVSPHPDSFLTPRRSPHNEGRTETLNINPKGWRSIAYPISGRHLTSSGSAQPLPAAESSCRNSSGSKFYTGCCPASPRTAQSSQHRSPRRPDWLSHVTMLPISRSWECRKACRSRKVPPGRPVDLPCLLDDAAPSLPRHYSGLNTTTSGSVPWRRIATIGLASSA
jgi:hypothetical protein